MRIALAANIAGRLCDRPVRSFADSRLLCETPQRRVSALAIPNEFLVSTRNDYVRSRAVPISRAGHG
jgi:hypothetical protein